MDQFVAQPPVFTQEPVIPELPKKKSFTWLYFSLILFLFSAAAVLGYKYWQLEKTIESLPELSPSPSAESLPFISETANWKDYSISELNLTFKLPPELTQPGIFYRVETPTEKGKQTCWALDMKQGFKLIEPVFAGGGSCTVENFTIGTTTIDHEAGRMSGFADYKTFQAYSTVPGELISSFDNQYGVKVIKILGKNAPKIDPLTESGFPINGTPGEGNIGALVKSKLGNYQVLTVQLKLTPELTEDIFDQILSTFKFIEQKSADQKTYVGNNFSISAIAPWIYVSDKNQTPSTPSVLETVSFTSTNDQARILVQVGTDSVDQVFNSQDGQSNSQVILDNVTANKKSGYGGIGGSVFSINIVALNVNKTYLVSFYTLDSENIETYEKDFDKFVSNFKFTD